jgi:DNA-binding NarL/FixJ family response regulator
VLKEASPEELVRAIETVDSGKTFFSPDVRVGLNQFVMALVKDNPFSNYQSRAGSSDSPSRGLSNKEIASALGIGVRTVETHRERIMRKLDIHSVRGFDQIRHLQSLDYSARRIRRKQ